MTICHYKDLRHVKCHHRRNEVARYVLLLLAQLKATSINNELITFRNPLAIPHLSGLETRDPKLFSSKIIAKEHPDPRYDIPSNPCAVNNHKSR